MKAHLSFTRSFTHLFLTTHKSNFPVVFIAINLKRKRPYVIFYGPILYLIPIINVSGKVFSQRLGHS